MAPRRDPLADYRNRRDFASSPEPSPGAPSHSGDSGPIFVVQRHEASRLHYDLRLETGGALASWAVPKGIPHTPGLRRLAVRTEDHPISYADFEGTIPAGEYGGGAMRIVDRGPVQFLVDPEAGLHAGKLEFILGGSSVRGEWHLVRLESGDWLLLKTRDRYVRGEGEPLFPFALYGERRSPLPRSLRPMVWGEESTPFDDRGWVFLPELDGVRVAVFIEGGVPRIRGGGRDLTAAFPRLTEELSRIRATDALLDGVLIAAGDDLRPDRTRLEARLAGDSEIETQLYLLDIIHFEDWRLRERPLSDRLRALRAVVPDLTLCPRIDPVQGDGIALAEHAATAGLTALWARKLDAPYRAGAQKAWRRIPLERSTVVGCDLISALSAPSSRGKKSRVRITRRERVYWPELGLTKGELLDYYAAVAPLLLPHLADRPLHLRRFPDGVTGEGFYQKAAPDHTPDWVPTATLSTSSGEKAIRHHLCPDLETLLYLVNLGSIDLHPWASRVLTPDSPDHLVIDLDPGSAGYDRTVRVARIVGRLLTGAGIHPHVKTSGSRGLHIYVSLVPGYTYDQAAMFAEMVARLAVRELPEIATVERSPGKRGDRVYVDFGQNRRGQTIVPPYVVRPVAAASVSVPLDWDELDPALPPSAFPFTDVLDRFERLGDLFAPVLEQQHSLEPAIEALGKHLGRK